MLCLYCCDFVILLPLIILITSFQRYYVSMETSDLLEELILVRGVLKFAIIISGVLSAVEIPCQRLLQWLAGSWALLEVSLNNNYMHSSVFIMIMYLCSCYCSFCQWYFWTRRWSNYCQWCMQWQRESTF